MAVSGQSTLDAKGPKADGWAQRLPFCATPLLSVHSHLSASNVMQPYIHAKETARRLGADWRDHLAVHEFIDVAKHACPDLRHRAVLHNHDLGAELAARAFHQLAEARDIALMHIRQDLRCIPGVAEWMSHCDTDKLPRYKPSSVVGPAVIEQAANHLQLEDHSPLQNLWSMLTLPSRAAPAYGDTANCLTMNGIGPVIARMVFGPPRPVPRRGGGEVVLDFGWACEGMIVACARHVPALTRILDCFDGKEPR